MLFKAGPTNTGITVEEGVWSVCALCYNGVLQSVCSVNALGTNLTLRPLKQSPVRDKRMHSITFSGCPMIAELLTNRCQQQSIGIYIQYETLALLRITFRIIYYKI